MVGHLVVEARDLSVAPIVPVFTIRTALSIRVLANVDFNSASQVIPVIVEPPGIANPKFVAFRYCEIPGVVASAVVVAYALFELTMLPVLDHATVPVPVAFAPVPTLLGPAVAIGY